MGEGGEEEGKEVGSATDGIPMRAPRGRGGSEEASGEAAAVDRTGFFWHVIRRDSQGRERGGGRGGAAAVGRPGEIGRAHV